MSEPIQEFKLVQPETLGQALTALSTESNACLHAGGTDLIVNMRRGLVAEETLVDLAGIAELKTMERDKSELKIGSGVSLREIAEDPRIAQSFTALSQAANAVAAPSHREVATIGGNLCLDTRCLYYNQSHWWRKSNSFCLKYKGDICHVAPKGNRCRAAFSGDLAPALMALNADVELAGPNGTRKIPLDDLYCEDGANHLTIGKNEILIAIRVPVNNAVSAYEKVRVRGAIDFPLSGVAVACTGAADGSRQYSLAVTGTNSMPVRVNVLQSLNPDDNPDDYFVAMGKLVQKTVSPQRTSTIAPHYRRLSVAALAVRLARGMLV